jgi:putative NADH-flavin reductase
MKVVIFGATGGTGQALVTQALAQGYEVTAVARTPSAVTTRHERLKIIQGDVMQPDSLDRTIIGQDIVLSTLGITGFLNNLKSTTLYSKGTNNILTTMKKHNRRRFVGITSSGVEDNQSKPFLYRWFVKPLLNNAYADMTRMEAIVMTSGLDWTIIRPAGLTNEPGTGMYRVALNTTLNKPRRISRADVAEIMLKTITDDQYVGTVVGVAQ